jgi:hypothetical protein
MKNILYICMLCSPMICCNNYTDNQESTSTDTHLPTSMTSPSEDHPEDLEVGYTSVSAIYKSCAVYAGATDYYFINEDGEGLNFRITNTDGYTEEEITELKVKDSLSGTDILMREQMTALSEGNEGPPGANPDLIDREFSLIYNESKKLVEVRLSD